MARSLLRRRGHLLVMYFFFHFLWRGPGSELRRPHGPLPWPTLLQINFKCALMFKNVVLRGILFFCIVTRNFCLRFLSLRAVLDFFAKPKCEPATSHTCGVVEAISLQATIVFGLLRYTRNDKSQDNHTAQVPFAALRSR